MNHRIVAKYMGYIMLVEGLFMIPSVFVSLWFGEPDTVRRKAVRRKAAPTGKRNEQCKKQVPQRVAWPAS